jgi:hypothetical protein
LLLKSIAKYIVIRMQRTPGTEYRINDRTTLSAPLDRLVWSNKVFDFKYRFSLPLAYEFRDN